MNFKQLKDNYDKLLKDDDFDKLDLGIKNPNIFQILRITKKEIRHSNFLSWLLDPNQSHKLGDIFLKRFLREVFSSDKFEEIDQVDVEGMNLSEFTIEREWKNIDILIKSDDVVVCVENKVLSKEHSNQLMRYRQIVENHFPHHTKTYVYLTPDGYESETEQSSYAPISYEFIVNTLEKITSIYSSSLSQQVNNYIKDYITTIKRDLMGTDKLSELSKKIYTNHKDLFDFIYEHKPDVLDEVREIFEKLIKKRGWVLGSQSRRYLRFTTPEISKLTYINKNSNGWRSRESFLFEFQLQSEKDRINFKSVISRSDNNYDSHRLSDMLKEINNFKEPIGKIWLVNYSKIEKFPFSRAEEITSTEIENYFNKILDKCAPIVQKVEDKFISNRVELLKMKS